MTYEFFAGRREAVLQAPFTGERQVFAGEVPDGIRLVCAHYSHCTFANVNFKQAEIDGSSFFNCTFVGCYFREAKLRRSVFRSCKFIACDFAKTELVGCDLAYASFSTCYLTHDQVTGTLPTENNLRAALAENLANVAAALGAGREARALRLEGLAARHTHLREAVMGDTDYHRRKFPQWSRPWRAAFAHYVASVVNRVAWGYGERAIVLVRNVAIALIVFPVLLWLVTSGIETKTEPLNSFDDYFYLSLANILPLQGAPGITTVSNWARLVFILQSLVGLLASGLFVTMLFRWILRR